MSSLKTFAPPFLKALALLLVLSAVCPARQASQKPKESKKPQGTPAAQPTFQFPSQQVLEQGNKSSNPQTPAAPNPPNNGKTAAGATPPATAQPAAAASLPYGLQPKRAGIPRIGIATTQGNVPPEQDDAVRAQIYEMLYGNRETSAAEAVLLREKLDRSILLEAKKTGCDYILLLNLDSSIKPSSQRGNGMLKKLAQAGGEAFGIANRNSDYYSEAAHITYRGYVIANSLQNSNALLDIVTQSTQKKDRVAVSFRLVGVGGNETVIPQTLKERTAQKKQEPIFQNVLIDIGNQILNSIPNP